MDTCQGTRAMIINLSLFVESMTKKRWQNQIALQQSKAISKILNAIPTYYQFPEFYMAAVGKELLHMPLSPDFTKLQRFTVYTS